MPAPIIVEVDTTVRKKDKPKDIDVMMDEFRQNAIIFHPSVYISQQQGLISLNPCDSVEAAQELILHYTKDITFRCGFINGMTEDGKSALMKTYTRNRTWK